MSAPLLHGQAFVPPNEFQNLVSGLSQVLGPSSGIDSADVDEKELIALMENYISEQAEWEKYAWWDSSRCYTRNLVDKGNGKSNLVGHCTIIFQSNDLYSPSYLVGQLVLVWNPGKRSPIHDHSDSHCITKVLKGSLKETLYDWPDKALLQDGDAAPPNVRKETVFRENEVTYISGLINPKSCSSRMRLKMKADQIGLHRISNPDPNVRAVSLHRGYSVERARLNWLMTRKKCTHRPTEAATASTRTQVRVQRLSHATFSPTLDTDSKGLLLQAVARICS